LERCITASLKRFASSSARFARSAASFAAIPVDGYFWTLRGDSLSGRKSFFAQDCDRVANWVQFFKILLEKGHTLADTQKRYLHYLLALIRNVCRQGMPVDLVKEATCVILAIAEKEGYDLDLSRMDRLLMAAPRLWKALDCVLK